MYKLLLTALAAVAFLPAFATEHAETANLVNPLLIGSPVPALTLTDHMGQQVDLAKISAEKNTILVFYRGSW